MLMEQVFERLKVFQDILTKRVELERQIHDIPKTLVAQEELLSRIKKTYQEKSEEYGLLTAKIAELKQQMAEAEGTRERAESQMDQISTQREFEALTKEIKESTDKEQECRRELQKKEVELAESAENLKREGSMIENQETEIEEKRAAIERQRDEIEAKIGNLKEEETKASEDIDSETIYKFERIIRSKQGVGIVPVLGTVCSGCHMILPVQFANEVRQGNKIIFCPYCSRILFYQEASDQTDMIVDIESGSLADLEEYHDEDEEGFDEADDDDKEDVDSQED